MTRGSRPRSPRSLLAVLAALLVLPAGTAGALEPTSVEIPGSGPFSDDDGSVFESDIVTLWAAGVVSGCDVGRFCPDDAVTRAEMAAMLRRSHPERFPEAASPFEDTVGSMFENDIAAIAAAGVTLGCAEASYCPDEPVTRQTMAAFLRRTFEGEVEQTRPPREFDDVDGSIFAGDIAWLAATGITEGCGATSFCPESPVTRGQMAAFLVRAMGLPHVEATDSVVHDLAVPTGSGVEGWRLLVEQFFEPDDVDRALRIIECESHADPLAKNPNSSASGLFQHLASQWAPRAEAIGAPHADVFDPIANVAAAAWLVYEGGGWFHWNASRGCWS